MEDGDRTGTGTGTGTGSAPLFCQHHRHAQPFNARNAQSRRGHRRRVVARGTYVLRQVAVAVADGDDCGIDAVSVSDQHEQPTLPSALPLSPPRHGLAVDYQRDVVTHTAHTHTLTHTMDGNNTRRKSHNPHVPELWGMTQGLASLPCPVLPVPSPSPPCFSIHPAPSSHPRPPALPPGLPMDALPGTLQNRPNAEGG